jgi:hypothetical protein
MNDTLAHPLNLPKIGGYIIAFFDWNFTLIKRLKKIHKSVILYRYLYEDDTVKH